MTIIRHLSSLRMSDIRPMDTMDSHIWEGLRAARADTARERNFS